MLMTEEQAKEKWCPYAMTFGRLQHYQDSEPVGASFGPQNRGYQMGGGLPNCNCLGSACAAWRWSASRWINRDGAELDWDPMEQDAKEIKRGFCGLAQEPDK